MADRRRIEVDIIANDESSRVFNRVATQSLTMSQRFNNAMTSISQNLHRYNTAMRTFNRYTQIALAGAGYMIYRFTKDSIKEFAEFEKQHGKTMGAIASNYDKTIEAQKRFINDSQKLKEIALKLGTVGPDGKGSLYNPQQISYAQTTLVKAGKTSEQLLSTNIIPQIVQFAGGNDIGIEDAAEYVVNIGNTFKIPMEKWGDMMDKITRTADLSTIDVHDIFQSLKYAGGIASSMKRPLEDVLAVIALMGNVGLRGSMAGTGLQAFLTRILNPVGVTEAAIKKAPTQFVADTLQAFIQSATTSDGTFKPLSEVTGSLDEIYSKLSDKEQAWFSHKLFGLFQMKSGFALAKSGGDTMQNIINEINQTAPGTNKRKWDIMLDTSWGKSTALSNAWSGIQTDVGYRLAPLTNAIADELFKVLSNKGNYKINFKNIQNAINKSSDMVAEQYGREIGDITKKVAQGGVNLARSGGANLPLVQGIAGGFTKIISGDITGGLKSFSDGIKKSNENIDKLPPELQGMAKEVKNAIIALSALSTVNFAARVADSIATIWRYSIGKLITANMNVAATSVLINTGLLNANGQPIYRGGGNSGGGSPVIVGSNGQPISGQTPPGSTIVGSDGRPIVSTGTNRGSWTSKLSKGVGVASWIYAIGEMTGLNSKGLDALGVKGDSRDVVDKIRGGLNIALMAKFVDSLLLKNIGTNTIKTLLTRTIPGMATGAWKLFGSAAGGGTLSTAGLMGMSALPVILGGLSVYRDSQSWSKTQALIDSANKSGKSWYWNDSAIANNNTPLGRLKALITGYQDSVNVMDSPQVQAAKFAEARKQNKYKYMEGQEVFINSPKPTRPWYDYLNPMSNYKSKLAAWEKSQADAKARIAQDKKYFEDAQKLSLRLTGQNLAWAEYRANMDDWRAKVDADRAASAATLKQLPGDISNALVTPFSGLIDAIKNISPQVHVNVTVDQNGNILKNDSMIGNMADMNNPFKIFNSRMGGGQGVR